MHTPHPASPLPRSSHRARWYLRAVPVAALGLGLLGIATALSPWLRGELALSLTRQPAPYVALYFPQPMAATSQTACRREGRQARVRFVIESHLSGAERVSYRVTVRPRGDRAPARSGRALVRPGEGVAVTRTLPVPAHRPYAVTVRLPGFGQRLLLRCRAGVR